MQRRYCTCDPPSLKVPSFRQHVLASQPWFLRSAEPDIHLRSLAFAAFTEE
jgi:hypothetical protein